MIRTEEEAKTLRCCGPSDCGEAIHEPDFGPIRRVCIASACMAWQTVEATPLTLWTKSPKPNSANPYPGIYSHNILLRSGGYCGLAGAPISASDLVLEKAQ